MGRGHMNTTSGHAVLEHSDQDKKSDAAALDLKDVQKSYGSEPAVRDLDLTIEKGEFLTLLGPSGSGKTTALMLIAGFLEPDTGDILVRGDSVLSRPPRKRNLGVVFQNYALFPNMTVSQNIAFPLRRRKVAKGEIAERVDAMLRLIHLQNKKGSYPSQLSGGQQQRVALARALVFEPDILLLDEPLGALDKQLRQHLQLELRAMHRRLGLTTLSVTHDQEEALKLSDRIAVMNDGRVLQCGPPDKVYDEPRSRFVAEFLGESNFLEGEIVDTKHDGIFLRATSSVPIHGTCTESISAGTSVHASIRPENVDLQPDSTVHDGLQTPLPCTVTESLFTGDTIQYTLDCAGTRMLAKVSSRRAGELGFVPGDRAHVTWHPRDLKVLVDELPGRQG